ncbi:MerR family transcriptional regulator [Solibacillus sp. FSL H8-0538]|uniref:MerR family transcriptional regulator n=1 Tax=Solibacillus sp. FSL H8-0538 TaxID=2921400 RepID=UPI0030F72E22
MEKYYSIGEVAKLTNISIQTLRYYDQIELFKPSHVDPQTNYRYYKDSQLFYLDFIKSLKHLGTSLEEIKEAQRFTPSELLTFLEQHEAVIEERLHRLTEIQLSLLKTKKQMKDQIEMTIFNEVHEKEEEATHILKIATTNLTPSHLPNTYYNSLKKILEKQGSAMISRYGCMFELKSYETIDDILYENVFTPLITDRAIINLTVDMAEDVVPAGRYICIAFMFSLEPYFEQYKKLHHYIEENKLAVHPIVYEIFMPTNFSPTRADEFIVELKVKLL